MNIVITGTSRGIGNQLAKYYCGRGDYVFGCSRGDNEEFVGDPRYFHTKLDVTEFEEIEKFASGIGSRVSGRGGIDVLINNAGISSMNHTLLTPISTALKIMNTNFMSTFAMSKEMAKLMESGGRIVNLTSIASPLNMEGEAIYSASKAAVESLTRTMSKELASMGITVNAVGPNPIKTDLVRGVPQRKMDTIIYSQSLKRYGTFQDIINVIDFFIKPDSSFITGQIIYLGGVS